MTSYKSTWVVTNKESIRVIYTVKRFLLDTISYPLAINSFAMVFALAIVCRW